MQSDEEEIGRMVSTRMAASKAGDAETVLSLMANDVVFLAVDYQLALFWAAIPRCCAWFFIPCAERDHVFIIVAL